MNVQWKIALNPDSRLSVLVLVLTLPGFLAGRVLENNDSGIILNYSESHWSHGAGLMEIKLVHVSYDLD